MAGIGVSVIKMAPKPPDSYKKMLDPRGGNLTGIPGKAKNIIVGGAGIAGLCCAYELMKKGHDVTVLEASGRHGGHVYSA